MTDASEPRATPQALAGLVVLDLSRILAGPTATQLLGDLGATVIKVENPRTGGDDTRSWGPYYVPDAQGAPTDLSAYFMSANRNKQSIGIDITSADGQALIHRLAARADVVIENYKPGGLAKYGLDHETLRAKHPALVYCSISGFGQTGPNRDQAGYDLMAQGYGGIMSLTGEAQGTPSKVGVGIADVMCGMYAAVGILAALRHRDATGTGQHIDLALVDTQMAWLINEGVSYLNSGTAPIRRGNAHPNIVPYEAFAAADGHILLAVGNDGQFTRFCDAFDLAALPQNPSYATNVARIENRSTLIPQIAAALAPLTKAEILDKCRKAIVPAGPINTVPDALTSEQARARGMVQTAPSTHSETGMVSLLGNPLKLSETPVRSPGAPPRFNEHETDILRWLDSPESD